MGKKRKKEFVYKHFIKGDIIKIEIRDITYRIIYRNKFNINDRKAMIGFLGILENYSGFSIAELLKEKLKIGEWV